MAIDPYSPCPCGSGKKLKFCCSDLAGDIEKVTKLIEGEQPHAALKHVETLLAKQPDRSSLLDIKAMIELSINDLDAAEKTLAHFLKVAPQNPAAHAQWALLAASRGEALPAVSRLQDALELTDNDMPQRVFEAIGAVGHALLIDGDMIAARAHLLLYAGVAPEGDNRALELLLRLNLQGGLPLLLRDNLLLMECPQHFATGTKATFEEGLRLGRRGLWRRAQAEFAKILNESNPDPAVTYNLALTRGWLGDEEAFAKGLHDFARLNVPLDEAVEAEALAQLVDPTVDEPILASVRLTYPILNDDAAVERLASDKRVEPYELDPETLDEDEITRPRSTHILLDRPVPSTGVGLKLDDAPNVLAFISVYGKRTDRDARLEVTTDRGEHFEQVKGLIAEILGDSIGGAGDEEVVAEKSASEEALSWRWRLPNDTPPALRRQLLAERRRRAIVDEWTNAPRAALNGLSPRDAANRAELKIPLLASVLIVEQAAADPEEQAMFQQLREQLGLPKAETVDPSSVDWERIPITRLPRLDLAKVPEDRLMQLFNRASMTGAAVASLSLANELVRRNTPGVDLAPVFRQLIRSEPDPDKALRWVDQADQWSAASQKPGGEWALLKLEVQIERGDAMGVQETLNDIRAKHLNEPGIAEATYRLLYTAGLLTPRGLPTGGGPLEAPAAAPSKLWTPDQAMPAAPTPPNGGTSAIWTP
jgi:tetratricopeptide (TPR) repeat protein